MKQGDYVEIKTAEDVFTGLVIPRPDILNNSIVILKLDSGYNIGISKDKIISSKVINKQENKVVKHEPLCNDPKLPNVAVVSIGGTISSKIDYSTGGVKADYDASDFLRMCPELQGVANLSANKVMQIMSEDVDLKTISEIAEKLSPYIKDESIDGVVVTLGTDCFHYITSALSFMIKTPKPIVFTASQRSIDRGSTDAFMNLSCSIKVASTWSGAEIVSCMHESSEDNSCLVIRGNKVRKMHTSRRDAFRPINVLPYARVTYPDLEIQEIKSCLTKRNQNNPEIKSLLSKDCALIHVHPGINPDVINYYVKSGVKGIVLAGTALGHVPTQGDSNLLPVIKDAISKGVLIVIASQTLYGRTHPFVYTNLRKLSIDMGCIFAEDMLPETAYMKLCWVIANYPKNVREKMIENTSGEINPIIDYDSFLY